jgi:hypothetical protein
MLSCHREVATLTKCCQFACSESSEYSFFHYFDFFEHIMIPESNDSISLLL